MNKELLTQVFTESSKDGLLVVMTALLFFAYQFKDNFNHCAYCLTGAFIIAMIRVFLKTYLSIKYKKKL